MKIDNVNYLGRMKNNRQTIIDKILVSSLFLFVITTVSISEANTITPEFRKTIKIVEAHLIEWQKSSNILIDARTSLILSGEIRTFKSTYGST